MRVFLQGSSISVVLSRNSPGVTTSLNVGNGGLVAVNPGSVSENATSDGVFDTHTVFWAVNPFAWSTSTLHLFTTVTSVEIVDPVTDAVVNVTHAVEPVVIAVPVPASTDTSQFRCSYWSEALQDWSDEGTVLLGFAVASDGSGGGVAYCGTVHLSDFAAVKQSVSFFVITDVHPIDDAGLVAQIVNPSNLLALFVVAALIIVFGTSWVVSYKHDEQRSHELEKLHRAHMVLFGEIRTGLGMHCLHLPLDHPIRKRVVALYDHLKVRNDPGEVLWKEDWGWPLALSESCVLG